MEKPHYPAYPTTLHEPAWTVPMKEPAPLLAMKIDGSVISEIQKTSLAQRLRLIGSWLDEGFTSPEGVMGALKEIINEHEGVSPPFPGGLAEKMGALAKLLERHALDEDIALTSMRQVLDRYAEPEVHAIFCPTCQRDLARMIAPKGSKFEVMVCEGCKREGRSLHLSLP